MARHMGKSTWIVTAMAASAALVVAGNATAEERREKQDGKRRRALPLGREQHRSALNARDSDAPRISAIVATKDRPELLRRCVDSILANDHDDFELVIVDQSRAPADLPGDTRVRHIRSAVKGKSAALNLGVRAARGAILAFTDDDCTAPPTWLTRGESLFLDHPEVEMAFGSLVPIDHDPTKFVVPGTPFTNGGLRIIQGKRLAYLRGGAGANLLARRLLFEAIGEWDEQIGPGKPIHGLRGVGHLLPRPREWCRRCGRSRSRDRALGNSNVLGWSRAVLGILYGEGAVIGKHLRLLDIGMTVPALRILLGDVLNAPRLLWHRQRPGFRSMLWKWRGIAAGFGHRVDRDRRVFLA